MFECTLTLYTIVQRAAHQGGDNAGAGDKLQSEPLVDASTIARRVIKHWRFVQVYLNPQGSPLSFGIVMVLSKVVHVPTGDHAA